VVAVTKKVYNVRAKRWLRGWELHVQGVGVTQARTLRQADVVLRDYIALMVGERQAKFADFVVVHEVGGLEHRVAKTQAAAERLAREQEQVAADYRRVAVELKRKGLTGEDAARVMQVSPQRYSQLLKTGEEATSKQRPTHHREGRPSRSRTSA
jgi:hypothetical protein